VSIQLGDVQDGVLTSKTVPELTSFIQDYDNLELVESVDDTGSEIPRSGYITVKTSDGILPRTAFDDLLQTYRSWHSGS
jgi:hypothetical protein